MRLLVALCILTGCAEHRVSTWPKTLAGASTDLRTRGEATIEVTEGDETSSREPASVRTVYRGQLPAWMKLWEALRA